MKPTETKTEEMKRLTEESKERSILANKLMAPIRRKNREMIIDTAVRGYFGGMWDVALRSLLAHPERW